MTPRRRVLILIFIMAGIVIAVETVAISFLYHTAIEEEKKRLTETVKSQARLIEALARYGVRETILRQLLNEAHGRYRAFGDTGEFTLGKKEGGNIVFLLNHRHYDLDNPRPVPFSSKLAEPMRLALSGKSGTVIDLDYRGEKVLAAYEPVAEINWGIVAKMDLYEARRPFMVIILLSVIIGILAIGLGSAFFLKVTNPLLRNLYQTVQALQSSLDKVRLLGGLLPICSSCKRIRDDQGYWNQIEAYIRDHSEAEFSHSICPDCTKKLYPDLVQSEKD